VLPLFEKFEAGMAGATTPECRATEQAYGLVLAMGAVFSPGRSELVFPAGNFRFYRVNRGLLYTMKSMFWITADHRGESD